MKWQISFAMKQNLKMSEERKSKLNNRWTKIIQTKEQKGKIVNRN